MSLDLTWIPEGFPPHPVDWQSRSFLDRKEYREARAAAIAAVPDLASQLPQDWAAQKYERHMAYFKSVATPDAAAIHPSGADVPKGYREPGDNYVREAERRELKSLVEQRKPGRNDKLNIVALTLARLPIDREALRLKLVEACEANGLIADDGLRAVEATIRSAFGAADREGPRLILDRDFDPDQGDVIETTKAEILSDLSDVDPVTLDEAHAVFRKWLGDSYDTDTLDAVLAAAAVERLDGDPLWLLVISGSGNAKTETVQSLDGIGAVVVSAISSDAALLSATPKKEQAKGATGGLLRRVGERGVLVVKDVTSILSMNRDLRAKVLAAFREIHDGRWAREVGTDGGKVLHWEGRIVLIGACTTAWDTAHSVIASMGDRFVLIRSDSTIGRVAAGRRAIGNTGSEIDMRRELAAAAGGVVAAMDTEPVELTEAETERLLAAADLVTLARTGVEYDYRGDVIDAHAPEMPTRFAKQIAQIVRGGVAIGMDRSAALRLAIRCARDSMPPIRLAIIDYLAEHPNSPTADVRRHLDKPRATVDRQLQALHMLGVLDCEECEIQWGGRDGTRWYYRLADGIDPTALDPRSVPDLSVHTPKPLERESGEDEKQTDALKAWANKSGTDCGESGIQWSDKSGTDSDEAIE